MNTAADVSRLVSRAHQGLKMNHNAARIKQIVTRIEQAVTRTSARDQVRHDRSSSRANKLGWDGQLLCVLFWHCCVALKYRHSSQERVV